MDHFLNIAEQNQKRAREIIAETGIVRIWESFGATVNLVGSLETGLLMKNLDIDFHIYSDEIKLTDSFAAITEIAKNPRIKNIQYTNLLDTDENCIEWHALYHDTDNRVWQIDMIHILKGSQYDGYFENVAERINAVLTPQTRNAILSIKNDLPDDEKEMGIVIYQAVIRDRVRDLYGFRLWKEKNSAEGIIEWMP